MRILTNKISEPQTSGFRRRVSGSVLKITVQILAALWIILATVSCRPAKFLSDDQKLLRAIDVTYTGNSSSVDTKTKSDVSDVLRPKPNSRTIGIQWRLWIYLWAENGKESRFKNRLQEKYGEAPVLLEHAGLDATKNLIKNRLENNGFFHSDVTYSVTTKRKKAWIYYTIDSGDPYKLRNYSMDSFPEKIDEKISDLVSTTALTPGSRYDLDRFRGETSRINNGLKEKGYYNFSGEYLYFKIDTSVGGKQFDMKLALKDNTPLQAVREYRMGHTYIDLDHSLRRDLKLPENFISQRHYYSVNDPLELFSPNLFPRLIFWRKDDIYALSGTQKTLRAFNRINAFQYSNISVTEGKTINDTAFLDIYIYVTPAKKLSRRLETSLTTKSTGFTGPSVTASLLNKNVFGSAENLNIRLSAGFETQLPRIPEQTLNSIELGINTELTIPHIAIPFRKKEQPPKLVGETFIDASIRYLNRTSFFSLNSATLALGYRWSKHTFRNVEFTPLEINFVQLGKTSANFDQILEQNPVLKRSFEQQLITGMSYAFTFSDLSRNTRKTNLYNNIIINSSGNFATLAGNTFTSKKASPDNPFSLLGVPYAQHIRIQNDFRLYLNLSKETRLILRLMGGIGYSYGNSNTMPYLRQFSSGGPSSIRAFRVRSLGPGSYNANQVENFSFFDQTGDMKLEANLEIRFPIVSILKGALFIDAGNIWNLRDNESVPGGRFNTDWYDELGIGTGLGLRFDLSIVILRLDTAFPIRKPWLESGQRFVLDQIRLNHKDWRKENLIFNLSLGYPF